LTKIEEYTLSQYYLVWLNCLPASLAKIDGRASLETCITIITVDEGNSFIGVFECFLAKLDGLSIVRYFGCDCEIVIKSEMGELSDYCFSRHPSISWLIFEPGFGCSSSKSICIPLERESIDKSAFEQCSPLKSIWTPSTVTVVSNRCCHYAIFPAIRKMRVQTDKTGADWNRTEKKFFTHCRLPLWTGVASLSPTFTPLPDVFDDASMQCSTKETGLASLTWSVPISLGLVVDSRFSSFRLYHMLFAAFSPDLRRMKTLFICDQLYFSRPGTAGIRSRVATMMPFYLCGYTFTRACPVPHVGISIFI
jgi:hypothetical protein